MSVERPQFGSLGAGAGTAAVSRDATDAVSSLVAELQAGWDTGDAAMTDRSLARDVLWGSPFGETLQGADELHDIHVRLKKQGIGGSASRFEIVRVMVPTDDVVLAQVRRQALDSDGAAVSPTADAGRGGAPFSEMILYVLVKRDDGWYLAAGHNTPIREKPEPKASAL